MAAFTGCKDHDDELCEIEERIAQVARDLDEMKTILGGDPVQSVTFADGTLHVVTQSGTVSYAIGEGTPVFDVTIEGAVVSVNGAAAGEIVGGVPPAKIDLLEDGTVVADGVEQPFNAIPEADRQRYIAFIRNASGAVVAVKVRDGGIYAAFDLEPSPVVTSLTHIPTFTDGLLGNVEFFPVLVYDDYSQGAQSPVFAYNGAGREPYESFVHGWLTLRYRVNPGHVDPQAVESVAFDHVAAAVSTQSRGAPDGLEIRPGAAISEGVLDVQVRGLRMRKWSENGDPTPGSAYDDPHGVPSDPAYGGDVYQADLLSLQAANRADGGVVASDYVAVKRLVIRQRDVEIGLAVAEDGQTPVPAFRDLSDMYTGAQNRVGFSFSGGVVTPDSGMTWNTNIYEINTNAYKVEMPVQLRIPYRETLHEEGKSYDVDAVARHYFTRYATNTGHVSGVAQYAFDDFGFGGMFGRRYFVEGYDDGHTNPSTGAPVYSGAEVMKYMRLTEDGEVSFYAGNTSSIGREPIIRVELRDTETDRPVMSKLIKIHIADRPQRDTVFTVGHVANQYVPCMTTDGTGTASWYIDLDAAYNAAGMGKSAFEAAYGTSPEITVTRGGQPVTQDVTFALAAPIRQRVAMTVTPDALTGNYLVTVKYTISPNNPTAPYKTITIRNAFTLSYRPASLTYDPSRWDTTDPAAPFFAVTAAEIGDPTSPVHIEDAFTAPGLKYLCGTLRFEAVEPTQGVTITQENGKHRLTIGDPSLYGQPLTLRAYFIHSTSANRGGVTILDDETPVQQPLYPDGGVGEFRVVATQ